MAVKLSEEELFAKRVSDKSFDYRKYFYKYYYCADFMNITTRAHYEYGLFAKPTRDVVLTEKLYEQIMAKPETKKARFKRYCDCFEEKLARISNEDGTFNFVFPSGKIIPDKFYALDSKGYKPHCFEHISVKRMVYVEGEKPHLEDVKTLACNFLNENGAYLLDQNKIRSIKIVCELLQHNPEYIKQITPNFFKPSNINLMIEAIDSHYKRYLERKGETFLRTPFVNLRTSEYKKIIDAKAKQYEIMYDKKMALKEEKEDEMPHYRPPRQEVVNEKYVMTEDEKRRNFSNLYEHIGYEQEDFEIKLMTATPLERIKLRKQLLEKKIELAELYRDDGVNKLQYIPKDDDDFLRKYEDDEEKWQKVAERNERLQYTLNVLESVVIQDFINKLYAYETKVDNYYTIHKSVVSKSVVNCLREDGSKWKEVFVYVPDLVHCGKTLRFGKTIEATCKCLQYNAVVNSRFPKEFLSQSFNDEEQANKLTKRLKRQIAEGNLILLCQNDFYDVKLADTFPIRERELGNVLPTLALQDNCPYLKQHAKLKDMLTLLIEENIHSTNKRKKKQTVENVEQDEMQF